tara:strand:- start:1409 stop:4093 length:2685 start_codon:yes stop_codon:yes gene_type:complete
MLVNVSKPKNKPFVNLHKKLKNKNGNTRHAKVTIIENNSSHITNNTHAILYLAKRMLLQTDGTLIEALPNLRKIGYTMVRDNFFPMFCVGDNDVWRAMVAMRLEAYNKATGGNFYWEIDHIIVVPRGIVGEKEQVDKDVQSALYNKLGIEFGKDQDLINLDFKNQIDPFKNKPKLISKHVHDAVIGLYNKTPNNIELDLAQALQVATIVYDLEQYYKENSSLKGFKHFAFDAPRTGKTLLTLKISIEVFAKKYGFTRIVYLNWVLTANASYEKEFYNWQELSRENVNLVNLKNPFYSNTKVNFDICSAHGNIESFKKRYKHMENYDGKTLLIQDEFDEGLTCDNQIEKAKWVDADCVLTLTGSGLEKASTAYDYYSMSSISFVEPKLLNQGLHPMQNEWYDRLPLHLKQVIDDYKHYTPAWSEARVNWNVGDIILDPATVETYEKIAGVIDKSVLLTMTKFLHASDNTGMRKDFYGRMLFGGQKSLGASTLNCGIELAKFLGHQPWTMLIDIEATNNKQFDTHVKEFNSWSIAEYNAIGIAVNGDNTDYSFVLEQLYNQGIAIELPSKFSNKTAEDKMNTICITLHKLGYKVVFFSKGMGFKSNSCEYIEVTVHMRDGGSIDIRYQAGARPTTPGLRFNGTDYVPKLDGFDMFVTLNGKPHANLMKQTINGMCQDTEDSMNRKRPSGCPPVNSTLFYKSIGVFTNESGDVKKLSIEEAYRYANTPEVTQAMAGAEAIKIADKLDHLSSESLNTLNAMFAANGNTRYQNTVGKNRTGGKSKPNVNRGSNMPPVKKDEVKKELMDNLFELLSGFTKNITVPIIIAEEDFSYEFDLDNIDLYAILNLIDDHEEIVEMFGATGKEIVVLFTDLEKLGLRILKPVSINHIATRQYNEQF